MYTFVHKWCIELINSDSKDIYNFIFNKYSCFEVIIHQKSWIFITIYTKILSSTTVLNIDNKNIFFIEHQIIRNKLYFQIYYNIKRHNITVYFWSNVQINVALVKTRIKHH